MHIIAKATVTAAALLSLTILTAAQNQPLVFEVASVKPNHSVGGSMLIGCDGNTTGAKYGISPGTCKAVNASLQTIIAIAYDIRFTLAAQHISGAPGWISTERYDIEAKAASAATTEADLKLMLRQLLADRFKLKLHEESKEVSGYALVVAKGGPKFPPPPSSPVSVACGSPTTQALSQCLAARLGQPVVDETNIIGRCNCSLTMQSLGEDQPDPPSIFTVLEEQLGLKLESRKIPSKMLVIDHVEKPSEN